MTVLGWGRERHSGRYASLENAGILRCAQNDDVKLTTARATAKGNSNSKDNSKGKSRSNSKDEIQGSLHCGVKSAPPSVEMTFVMGVEREQATARTRQRQRQELAGRRYTFPP